MLYKFSERKPQPTDILSKQFLNSIALLTKKISHMKRMMLKRALIKLGYILENWEIFIYLSLNKD